MFFFFNKFIHNGYFSGRIVNRFSSDISTMDGGVPMLIMHFFMVCYLLLFNLFYVFCEHDYLKNGTNVPKLYIDNSWNIT